MTKNDADLIGAIPRSYATLLIMRAAGRSDAEIADRLGLPCDDVETMAEVARRKVERILGSTAL